LTVNELTDIFCEQDGSIHVFVLTEHYFMLVTQKYTTYEGREVKPVIKSEAEVIETEATEAQQ